MNQLGGLMALVHAGPDANADGIAFTGDFPPAPLGGAGEGEGDEDDQDDPEAAAPSGAAASSADGGAKAKRGPRASQKTTLSQ